MWWGALAMTMMLANMVLMGCVLTALANSPAAPAAKRVSVSVLQLPIDSVCTTPSNQWYRDATGGWRKK